MTIYNQTYADAAKNLLEEWTRLEDINVENVRKKAIVCRSARDLGLDVDWLKAGSIVWRRQLRPKFKNDSTKMPIIKPPTRRQTQIYVAVNPVLGFLKVGISVNPIARVKSMETPGMPLIVWGCFDGKFSDEKLFHNALRAHKIGGEWFRINDKSIAICEDIFSQHRVRPVSIPTNVISAIDFDESSLTRDEDIA